jgi:putative transposase
MRQKIPRGPMPKRLEVSEQQESILQQIIRRPKSPQSQVMRAKIVLAGRAYGRRNSEIARELNINSQTVSTWRGRWLAATERLSEVEAGGDKQAVEQAIIQTLSDEPRSGTPPTFSAEQVCQIIAVACEEPKLSGRPITEWTPRELADEVIKREIVSSISASQVWRFLKRGAVAAPSQPLLAKQQET